MSDTIAHDRPSVSSRVLRLALQVTAVLHLLAFAPAIYLIGRPAEVYFAGLFVAASLWCGWHVELSRTRHMRAFFSMTPQRTLTIRNLSMAGLSVLVRILIGLLALFFILLGADQDQLISRLAVSVVVVIAGLVVLRVASDVLYFDEARVTYVFGPLVLGTLFAFLLPQADKLSLSELVGTYLWGGGPDNLDMQADQLRGAMVRFSELIQSFAAPLLGEAIAWFLGVVVSVNTLFGTVLTAFTTALMLLARPLTHTNDAADEE